MWSPRGFFVSGSCCVSMSSFSLTCTGSLPWIPFQVFLCVMGISERPDFMSSMDTERISEALSPIDSHSFTNAHIWHLDEEHVAGCREAKSLVCISLPDLCLNSIGIELKPVRKVDILALAEKAPR